MRQVLKHKPLCIRPAYFHSCVPSHYFIFESEVRSLCCRAGFRNQRLVWEATARSATGSCPQLVVFCALVPLFPNLQLLCAKTSVLPVDMREHSCKPCNTTGLYASVRLPNALSITDIFSFSFCFLYLLAFWTAWVFWLRDVIHWENVFTPYLSWLHEVCLRSLTVLDGLVMRWNVIVCNVECFCKFNSDR